MTMLEGKWPLLWVYDQSYTHKNGRIVCWVLILNDDTIFLTSKTIFIFIKSPFLCLNSKVIRMLIILQKKLIFQKSLKDTLMLCTGCLFFKTFFADLLTKLQPWPTFLWPTFVLFWIIMLKNWKYLKNVYL